MEYEEERGMKREKAADEERGNEKEEKRAEERA